MTNLLNAENARRAVDANTTDRTRWLDKLERYVKGTQYAHLKPWYDETDVPVLERAPCVIYPAARNAIRSHVALIFGEGRFPKVTSSPGEDDSILDEERGLSEEESAKLDAFVNGPLAKHVRLVAACKELLRHGMGHKTACAVVAARHGRLVVEPVKAKHCTPTFVENGKPWEVASLEIRYPFLQRYWDDAANQQAVRAMLYRRIIDGQRDVTFRPVPANEDGRPPPDTAWQPDRVVEHGLGFCPVIWYAFRSEATDHTEYDGQAIHEELLDEIDSLNRTLSQRDRAVLYLGDPQPIETGVQDEVNPTVSGRTPLIYVDRAENGVYMSRVHGGNKAAMRKGPGVVWRYPDPNSRVSLLTLDASSVSGIDAHQRDLKSKLDESFSVVLLDPNNSSVPVGSLSGVALRRLFMRQTAECDDIRDDVGTFCVLPLVDMLLRMIVVLVGDQGKTLLIQGVKTVAPILAKFVQTAAEDATEAGEEPEEVPDTSPEWVPPELHLDWPDYFDDAPEDEMQRVQVASAARQAGIVPIQHAVEKVSRVFGIKSPAEVSKSLEQEAADKAQSEREHSMALASAKMKPGQPGKGEK